QRGPVLSTMRIPALSRTTAWEAVSPAASPQPGRVIARAMATISARAGGRVMLFRAWESAGDFVPRATGYPVAHYSLCLPGAMMFASNYRPYHHRTHGSAESSICFESGEPVHP